MRRGFLGALASLIVPLGAALLLSSCDLLSGAHRYRYRVTVEVNTPQGVRSGSSVWQVTTHQGRGLNRRLITQLNAEAVPVNLPGGTLFALLRAEDVNAPGMYAAGVVEGHLMRHPSQGIAMTRDWAENMRRIAKAKPAFDLDADEYPLLVRFRDPNDPASVERVDPNELSDTFGSGTSLKRISVAVTSDRPGSGQVDQLLPWLEHHRGDLERCRGVPRTERPLKCRLTNGDFQRNDS